MGKAGTEGPGGRALIVATHRRSGTHWLMDLLMNNSQDIDRPYVALDRLLPDNSEHCALPKLEELLRSERVRLVKTHADADLHAFRSASAESRRFAETLVATQPVVTVVRDGRDVMVSLWHYRRAFDRQAAQQPFSDFLRAPSRIAHWVEHVVGWLAREGVIVVRYEDLHADAEAVIRSVLAQLGLQAADRFSLVKIDDAVRARRPWQRAARRLGLNRGSGLVTTAVEPRRGISGDWEEHFSPDDLAFYDGEVRKALSIAIERAQLDESAAARVTRMVTDSPLAVA